MSRKANYCTPADEYVFSPQGISLRHLAIKWGVSFKTLGRQSSAQGWVKQRGQYQDKVRTTGQQIAAQEFAGVSVKAAKAEMADLVRVRNEALARIFPPEGKKRPGMGGFARAVSALVMVDRQMLLRRGVPTERAAFTDPRERYEARRRRFYHAQRTARAVNGLGRQEEAEPDEDVGGAPAGDDGRPGIGDVGGAA